MQEELSDFLKTAYEHGKVKDLKDAFEEYPAQEEWHTHYGRVIDTLLADGIIRRCSIPSNTITYIVQKPKNTQENDKAKENSR